MVVCRSCHRICSHCWSIHGHIIYVSILYLMPFIHNYPDAMLILSDIGTGTCKGRCKSSWIRNLRYSLKTNTNPLGLTKQQRKTMTTKLNRVSGRNSSNNHSKTLKKYQDRKSPPFPANEYCNKKQKGNDGNWYLSVPNKNNVCSWRVI